MTDKEKLDKVLSYVSSREDFFYSAVDPHNKNLLGSLICSAQAACFQEVRYLIEQLTED